jgi:hypothetical protein
LLSTRPFFSPANGRDLAGEKNGRVERNPDFAGGDFRQENCV